MEAKLNSKISVETTIQLPVEKVWDFWTDPRHIVNWNNASDDWYTPKAENDLRVGGIFLSRMEARDGSFGFDFSGKYTKVIKNKEIGYVMEDGREVQVILKKVKDGTLIREIFDPEMENSRELQQTGWQAILNNFRLYAEKTKP